jgi:hypothetical protein
MEVHIGSLAIVVYAAVPAILFALWYGLHSRWWKDKLGIVFFAQAAAIAITMLYVLVANIWPDLPGRVYLRVFLFTIVGTAFWGMFIILALEQKKARDNPDYNRRRSDMGR